MQPVIVDPLTLTALVEAGQLMALIAHAKRLVLSPTAVEVLMANGVIEALVTEEIEPLVDVVSLTQQDEALAQQLLDILITSEPSLAPLNARAIAEGLALTRRSDLAGGFLCDDPAVQRLAQAHSLSVIPSSELLDATSQIALDSLPAPLPALALSSLDEETRTLLAALVARGLGADEGEVLRRAVRALAVGVGLREG